MSKSYYYMDGALRKRKSGIFHYFYDLPRKVVGVDEEGNVKYGKRRQKSKSTKCKKIREAKEWVRDNYDSLYNLEKNKSTYTNFSESILSYFKLRKNSYSKTTFAEYIRIINKYIIPFFGKKIEVSEINNLLIQKYIYYLHESGGRRKKGLSANTIKRHYTLLNQFFDHMLYLEEITKNPAKRIRLPKVKKYNYKIYNQNEITELLSIMKGTVIETAIHISLLGLRRGEVLGLQWTDIDFENKIMHIKRARVKTKEHNEGEVVDLKNNSSFRSISLPNSVIEILKKERVNQKSFKNKLKNAYNNNDYIACYRNGEPFKPDYLSKKYKKIIKKSNLKEIRLHDLRHTASTYMIMHGVPYKTVSSILGHSNVSTTLDIYTHTTSKAKKEAAKINDNLYK